MPDDPVVRFGLAGAYLDAGLAEEAVAEYREAVRLKPDYTAPTVGSAARSRGRAARRGAAAYGRARGGPADRRSPDREGDRSVPEAARPPALVLGYTPPARRDPSDRRHARAAARARVSPPAVAPRDERARGGRLREAVGFCSTFYRFPEGVACLWEAVVGRSSPRWPRRSHHDAGIGLTWELKTRSRRRSACTTESSSRGRPLLVALELFPAFYAQARDGSGRATTATSTRRGGCRTRRAA